MNQGRQLYSSGGDAAETRGPAASARRPAGSCVGMGDVENVQNHANWNRAMPGDGQRIGPETLRATMVPNRAVIYSAARNKTLKACAMRREVRA